MKIAVVTCYDQQNYVRAYALRKALKTIEDVEVIDLANKSSGLLRYVQTPWIILKSRFTTKPDAYVVTFRGYEMLLYMVLTLVRKPILFDELINFTEWMEEHRLIKNGTWQYETFRRWYAWQARKCRIILSDTEAHARYSAELNRMSLDKYAVIPVGTNQEVFAYRKDVQPAKPFKVFYYGSMLPLHGLKYLLDAAVLLKGVPGIEFHIVGGKEKAKKLCASAQTQGANVRHDSWVDFGKLPDIAAAAGLAVGGPFGGTLQSQYVITGKTYQFMSLGVPVIVGKNLVSNDFIDRQNCLLAPQRNADAIAEAIRWAYSHPRDMKQIATAGHLLYEEKFSQKVIDQKVNDLLKRLKLI